MLRYSSSQASYTLPDPRVYGQRQPSYAIAKQLYYVDYCMWRVEEVRVLHNRPLGVPMLYRGQCPVHNHAVPVDVSDLKQDDYLWCTGIMDRVKRINESAVANHHGFLQSPQPLRSSHQGPGTGSRRPSRAPLPSHLGADGYDPAQPPHDFPPEAFLSQRQPLGPSRLDLGARPLHQYPTPPASIRLSGAQPNQSMDNAPQPLPFNAESINAGNGSRRPSLNQVPIHADGSPQQNHVPHGAYGPPRGRHGKRTQTWKGRPFKDISKIPTNPAHPDFVPLNSDGVPHIFHPGLLWNAMLARALDKPRLSPETKSSLKWVAGRRR